MKDLKELLLKFKSLGYEEHKIKDSFIEILKEEFDLDISRKQIDLKERRINLKISGPVKTEITLKKRFLLEKINSKIEDLNTTILDIN